jgi:methionyl-tRNA formyltransferase
MRPEGTHVGATASGGEGPRVLFFGMLGPLSRLALERLLGAGLRVCGVVLAAEPGAQAQPVEKLQAPDARLLLPLVGAQARRTIVELAAERGIPALRVAALRSPVTLAALRALRPDLGCLACFPRRLPPELLALPPLGMINLHPAPLPRYRGPAPIFWQLRDGHTTLGLTIHLLDEQLDSGPTLAQTSLALADGLDGPAIDRRCGALGGELLAEAARALHAGTANPQPQPPGGSYQPSPGEQDFGLDSRWAARRAFNFMRGTEEWGQPYHLEAGDASFELRAALGFEAAATLGAPYRIDGARVAIQFAPGVLWAMRKDVAARAPKTQAS